MEPAVMEFLRTVTLLGVLNLLTVTIVVILSMVTILFGRRTSRPLKRVVWGMVPLLIALVTMCVDYSTSDRDMFGRSNDAEIAASRSAALVHGVIGVLGAAIFIGTGLLARQRKIGNGV
jgi:Mn2+/Fe2+ NRAMP family transporter